MRAVSLKAKILGTFLGVFQKIRNCFSREFSFSVSERRNVYKGSVQLIDFYTISPLRNTIFEFSLGDICQLKFIRAHLSPKSKNENASGRVFSLNSR